MTTPDPSDTIPCPRSADETWPPMTDRDTLPSLGFADDDERFDEPESHLYDGDEDEIEF